MRTNSRTIRLTNAIVEYYGWIILRGPGTKGYKGSMYNCGESEYVLGVF